MGWVSRVAVGMAMLPLLGQEPGLVIRSNTQLVQVHVVALDSDGKPVADLLREDFQLLDRGKPQPLTLFTAERGGAASNSATPPRRAAPQPGAADNYAVIVLDWLNTRYADQLQAHDQVVRLLQTFQPRQQVALYLLGRQPRLLHGFTTDRDALLRAVEEAVPEYDELETVTVGRFDARYGSRVGAVVTAEEQLLHQTGKVRDTLHEFETIADVLVRAPGRKTLLWLSSGFPVLIHGKGQVVEASFSEDFERVLGKLNTADVAVYPVDAQGLAVQAHGYRDTLMELASRTGGNGFYDRNDLDEGMRLALEDLRVSYTLGFHVPEGAAAGLHEIEVRVNRPGVRLRYRESYQLTGAN